MSSCRRRLLIVVGWFLVVVHDMKGIGVLGKSVYEMASRDDITYSENGTKIINGSTLELTGNCCDWDDYCADANSYCLNCTCLCKEGFVPSTEVTTHLTKGISTSCLSFTGNLPERNCTTKADCEEGFLCQSNKCSCPSPCKFNQTEQSCACSQLDPEPPPNIIGPVIVGFILGAIFTGCWIRVIRGIIKRHKAKRDRVRRLAEGNVEISTLGAAYGTDHILIQPAKNQQLSHYGSQPSPLHNHRAIAPASPLLPAFNAYGQNINCPFERRFVSSPPPPYPGSPPMMSLPAYPTKEEPPANLNVPFSSMPHVYLTESEAPTKDRQWAESGLELDTSQNYQYIPSASEEHLEAKMDLLRPNRSARF